MKKLLFLLSIFLVALSFTSCKSKEKSEEFSPSLDTKKSCSIKVVGSYGNFEALEKEFDKFNEYYPNVRLSYVKIDDYDNTIGTVLDGNDKPNIFFSSPKMIGNDKYNSVVNHMEDISNSILKSNLDCIRPGLFNNDSNGKVLMIPIFSRTYGMLVNNDLFKKEGINIPTTFNELKDVSKKFLDKGYKSPMMGYTLKSSSCLMNTIAYPLFVASLAKNKEALALANNLDPKAGEYMRSALEIVADLANSKCFDITECDKILDNYEKVLLRFFEGDVPMMACQADAVSGTKKREGENPFSYSYMPIPLTSEGGYFIDSPSIEFSINKDCENLDITNEFMRFLVRTNELNEMALAKGLVSPTKVIPNNSIYYANFSQVLATRTFSPEDIGIKDPLTGQLRNAAYKVGRKELTIDEAVANYGSFA
jgi:multiple sugar transport system substrate-binding protein